MKLPLVSLFLICCSYTVFSQTDWGNTSLTQPSCFIKNNGQFDPLTESDGPILFKTTSGGLDYYFTANGYTIVSHKWTQRTEKEKERLRKKLTKAGREEIEERELAFKTSDFQQTVVFEKSNENIEVVGELQTASYYSYSAKRTNGTYTSIAANGFQRLIYKNIYDHIDLVFEIPTDTTGLKYSFILHPGANPALIQITYPNNKGIKLLNDQLEIETSFGKLIDHQPFSYKSASKEPVSSNFVLSKGNVGFQLSESFSEEIVIDPWIVSPFANAIIAKAYDVDYDSNGNVYVSEKDASNQIILQKYSNAGVLIWTYIATAFTQTYYGDFAIDRNTDEIYLVEGFNSTGAQIIKLDSDANQIDFFAGNPLFMEMWRISFSRCTNQAVIAGGGVTTPTYQTCFVDENLSNLSLVQFVMTDNCCHDVNMLALDDLGNSYQVTNYSSIADNLYSNVLVKLPLPTLSPEIYNVPTGYNLNEAATNAYYDFTYENGYNGIAVYGNYVFTYDSYKMVKRNGIDGSILATVNVSTPPSPDYLIYWGGLSVDECGNLFVGIKDSVYQYDSTLALIHSYLLPDDVYDVVLTNTGQVLACGRDFVTSFTPLSLIECGEPLSLSTTFTNAFCGQKGSASVSVSGGTPPYFIEWNTSPPQYTATVTGLDQGTYTVTVGSPTCAGLQQTASVTISGSQGTDTPQLTEPTNVFSPDGDQINDLFYPFVDFTSFDLNQLFESYELKIIDRWGVSMFETTDPKKGWDGKVSSGKQAVEGVYFWKINAKTTCGGEQFERQGFVQLER